METGLGMSDTERWMHLNRSRNKNRRGRPKIEKAFTGRRISYYKGDWIVEKKAPQVANKQAIYWEEDLGCFPITK